MPLQFCDTNILVYAYDRSAGARHDQAQGVVRALFRTGEGVISIQVLQELFWTLTHKVRRPLPAGEARAVLMDLTAWIVVVPGAADVLAAIDASVRWQVSFWDAMILTAAGRAGAQTLWSEDLSDGQRYGDITVRNPFSPA